MVVRIGMSLGLAGALTAARSMRSCCSESTLGSAVAGRNDRATRRGRVAAAWIRRAAPCVWIGQRAPNRVVHAPIGGYAVSGTIRGALVAFIVLLGGAPLAANWPQWRGPPGHGVSAESDLPTTWSQSENVAWSAALGGLGSSSPIVWRDQVFVTSQIGRLPLSGSHPMLARDDATLVPRERPIGGRRAEPPTPPPHRVRRRIFHRSEAPPLGVPLRARGPFPTLHEKHNLATPTPVPTRAVFAWSARSARGPRHAWRCRGRSISARVLPVRHQLGHGSSPVLYRGC